MGKKKAGGLSSGCTKRTVKKKREAQRKAAGRSRPAKARARRASTKQASGGKGLFPIVGIGASAGGLEAFCDMLVHLLDDTGMAFVFIQHLDPRHKSNLVEIFSRSTGIPVQAAAAGLRLEPDRIYVMPPDRDLTVSGGVLELTARPGPQQHHMPVDQFFCALAEDRGTAAIGIVLSGTGSDGTAGLRQIKAAGGIAFAQDEESARYSGMPRSAKASGIVDFVLTPSAIAGELSHLGRHPYMMAGKPAQAIPAEAPSSEAMTAIFAVLRSATQVDFSHYKRSTVQRRISRRMMLHKLDTIEHYARYLRDDPSEVHELFEDMLINVTGFFREPEIFEALRTAAFPRITAGKSGAIPLRIWVPGCSTGEEVYSIAMSLFDYLAEQDSRLPVQIFATDVSEKAIEQARVGQYPASIAADVPAALLDRYFAESDSGYCVAKSIRDACIFSRQNVTRDPPFSRIDLISCRNLLIYLDAELQRRVIPVFHYALNPDGVLLLGASESIGAFTSLFSPLDTKHKIYAPRPGPRRILADFGAFAVPFGEAVPVASDRARERKSFDLLREADRTILTRYAPAGVVVNERLEVVQFRGHTGRFLEPPPGEPQLDLLKMVRPGLLSAVRKAVQSAKRTGAPAREEGAQVHHNGSVIEVDVEAIPVGETTPEAGYYLVVFEEKAPRAAATTSRGKTGKGRKAAGAEANAKQRLSRELDEMREALQAAVEEHEASNEELRAANEEIQSSNEELQSTNEELETAKEELQSANEELITLNEELENRNVELCRTADDLNNILESVSIAVLVLDHELRIRTITQTAEHLLGIRSSDMGRPIGELSLGVDLPDLPRQVGGVIRTLKLVERQITSRDGRAIYDMVIRPYQTAERKIEGAVIVLIDITDKHRLQREVQASLDSALGVVDAVREPLVVLDAESQVVSASRSFYRTFKVAPEQTVGRSIFSLGDGQWDIPQLRELLGTILPENTSFDDFEVTHDFPGIGRRTMMLNARQVPRSGDGPTMILLAIEDVTDAKR